MCEVLEISTSTYYKYRDTVDRDYADYEIVRKVFEENNKVYGYRRVTQYLRKEYGWCINAKKVARIMRKYNIEPQFHGRLKVNHQKRHAEENAREDLLKRDFKQRGWVTDITYLKLVRNGRKVFLSTILDLETRQWVAYRISFKLNNALVIDTLREAIVKEKDPNGLILHSDQGFQYLSTEYKSICESKGILISHARKGNPLDNAVIESFHSILKKETLYNNSITSLEHYISLVQEWMYFYNTTRLRLQKK